MMSKGTKLFPDDIRTIAFVTDKIRTTISARLIFRDEATKATIPDWVCQRVDSPEGITLKQNLFIDSHLVYDENKRECLRILDWFPGAVDWGHDGAQEALIPWDGIKALKAQTETKPM